MDLTRLKYTICFLRRNEEILLLNRIKAPNLGLWNGIGGKLEPGETPAEGIQREIFEEAGLIVTDVKDKGCVTWNYGGDDSEIKVAGGMHLFCADLPADLAYPTPKRTAEGILDFRGFDWILDPANKGVVSNIKFFLTLLFEDFGRYEHRCSYRQREASGESFELSNFMSFPLD